MAHHFKNFSVEWFGNGWFGFLYSLPIAWVDMILNNDMLSSFIVNILLFNMLVGLCYLFGKNYLSEKYNYLLLVLLFLSPILLNYNIHILSENIYIPLFFILFIGILNYKKIGTFWNAAFLGFMLCLLYLTRAEAFIYLWSIGLVFGYLWLSWHQSFGKTFWHGIVVIATFFICAFPYIFYLHSFTGEWGLTNKWSSNIRQADLRGVSKMDDDGFEQAVGELRPDNKWLIAWFAGGLKYEKPMQWEGFVSYMLKDPQKVINRIKENQSKLFTSNLPHLFLWNAKTLYEIPGSQMFYKNYFYLFILSIPILLALWWIVALVKNGERFMVVSFLSFFLTASLFFTLFFVLDRYFVIFVPLFLFFFVYGVEQIKFSHKFLENFKYMWASLLMMWIFALWNLSYYNTFAWEDAKYKVKKEAWEYLKQYHFSGENLKILERFPVVTYYSGSKERWLTPYTDRLVNLLIYANHNNIDYLVVDSVDFFKYRPWLQYLFLQPKDYPGLKKFKEFEKNGEKVILYKIEK
jgi:hypothetical protein